MPSHKSGALKAAARRRPRPSQRPEPRPDPALLSGRALARHSWPNCPMMPNSIGSGTPSTMPPHAGLARLTGGLSPAALSDAYMDWAVHLAISPGKQVELAARAARQVDPARAVRLPLRDGRRSLRALHRAAASRTAASPDDEWQQWPFNIIHQAPRCGYGRASAEPGLMSFCRTILSPPVMFLIR